ncbi:MAG TPA: aminotransferase class I/II-fold pyridoxal phosphate-dependent enzyme [candidate division WOR-3 bacterium]|uniref:L-methionine gamma-lyase n=1 Tax=candidate division WOR-3 bacterium TaxID=2052148 RepID=A0A7V0XG49_UNCW3|nr:aminotransferase class I/II-fold pyridoxal phosphate-dependent enzyme [candidate division WOR-3 bacterium]
MNPDHKPATHCVHAGQPETEGPVVTPIVATSTFRFRDADHGAALFAGRETGYIYTRMLNPTVKAFEDCLAALEGGTHGLATASGMAAVSTAIAGLGSAGDHVICSKAVYGPTCTFLTDFLSRFGVESSMVDTTDLDKVRAAFRPSTKLVVIETPGNPTLAISDIAALAGLVRERGARLIVDNTFMSPILQQPLRLGADVVIHSLTKFLNGHADVIGGAIIVKDEELYRLYRRALNHYGGVLSPFESFLVHRGIKSLALRMQRHCENAQAIAEFLESHPAVERVHFPGLASHPQYELARRQMSGPGGVISFELRGGFDAGRRMMNATRLCALAVSLGGVESLIQHPASMTHAGMTEDQRCEAGITEGLVRVSVGIEDVGDIRADLEQALA